MTVKFKNLKQYETFRYKGFLYLKGLDKAMNLSRLQYGDTKVELFYGDEDVEPESVTEIWTERGRA